MSRHHRLITLGRSGTITRRAMLTNLGAAGLGLTIFGACAGSSDGGASSETGREANSDATATDTASVDTATIDSAGTENAATDTAGVPLPTDPATPESSDEPAPSTDSRLQLQQVSLGFVSAYVLLRGNEAAIVDTGTGDSAAAILEGLGAVGATWADVAHVVLTHNHGDHAGGLAGVLAQAPGATVYAGEADLAAIESSATLRSIGDGDEVLGLGVVNTPGHTAGSISLFDTSTGILVAGDAITGDNGMLSGANPEFSDDVDTAATSVAKLAALEPRVAAFGHGGAPIDTDVTAQLLALADA